ncbi:MAG TPA: sodium:solute symporter [Candidatus Atribacteria bacterium]|nr:sodium:solute symporter [Candidatus Atribacteria bacterium]
MSGITVFGIFFVIFGVLMTFIGFVTKKWIGRSSDFIVAGREVNLIVNILGVASIGYAGTTLALSPAFTIMGGLTKSVFMLGVCYALVGIISYGIFVAPIARRSGAHTLPEWMEIRYDNRVRTIIALTAIMAMIGITANNVVSMAYILTGFTSWNLLLTITICFIIFLSFTYLGGLWAITLTDFVQGIICVFAVPLLIIVLLMKYGGWNFVASNWPGGNPLLFGISGTTFPWFSLRYPSVFVALFLYGMALVWGSNHYWIRSSSVRSDRIARNSYLWAALILFVANGIIYPILGGYVGAAYPSTFAPLGKIPPAASFGVFLKAISPVSAAYLLLTTVAASISTATATHIAGSSMIFRDIYQRIFRPNAKPEEMVTPSRVISLVFGIVCLGLCFFPGGPVYLFAFGCAWLAPSAIIVFLGMYWKRTTNKGAFIGGIIGILFLSVWTILDLTKLYPMTAKFGHMVIPGVVITFVLTVIVSLFDKSKYFGKLEEKDKIKLIDKDIKVLDCVRKGYNTMAEITDILDVDSSISNKVVGKLENGGYIKRLANCGVGFYTFELTRKGKEVFPPPSSTKEEKLTEDKLDMVSLKILRYIDTNPNLVANKLIEITGLNQMANSVLIASLIRRGLLKESGMWRRIVTITQKGKEMLRKHRELLEGGEI